MFAFGKIIENNLKMPNPAENLKGSLLEKKYKFLKEISKKCMKDPKKEIEEHFTYSYLRYKIREEIQFH